MAKPFTSLDGVDPSGVRAEVHVQTGTGLVKALEESGKNVLVKMQVEGLKHPVQGWTSTQEPIYQTLVAAKEQGREVSYRIESQRKNGVDRKVPIAELRKTQEIANDNTRSLFVGVDGALSSEAVTDPAEDPHAGGRIPATDPRNKPSGAPVATGGGFSVEQALTGLANARQGGLPASVVDATAALALAAGASVQQVMNAGVTEQNDAAPRPVQRAVSAEAAPHVQYNTDGRVNLGSYAVQAAVGAESLAADLIRANLEAVAQRHNDAIADGSAEGEPVEVQPVNYAQAAALGGVLLSLADQVQVTVYGAGRPNRMASSHTRCRSYVYDAVKHRYPVPLGMPGEAQDVWKQQVIEEAVSRFQRVIRMVTGESEAPAAQAPQEQAPQAAPAAQEQAPAAQAPQEQAPQAAPAAQEQAAQEQAPQVRHIGSANSETKRKPPVEGDPDFVAPSQETLGRFAALAHAAGFASTPDSPVLSYLTHKFGVMAARKVDESAVLALVEWYEKQGEAGPAKFRQHVLAEAGTAATA